MRFHSLFIREVRILPHTLAHTHTTHPLLAQTHTHTTPHFTPHTTHTTHKDHTTHTPLLKTEPLLLIIHLLTQPALWDICVSMMGGVDVEGSRSNVATKAWLPRASGILVRGQFGVRYFEKWNAVFQWRSGANASALVR